MPRFVARGRAVSGLYGWLGALLEERGARPHPAEAIDGRPRPAPVSEALRQFRRGGPVTVPAWLLDGHSAREAGFAGLVPADTPFRARAYVVGPDDSLRPAV